MTLHSRLPLRPLAAVLLGVGLAAAPASAQDVRKTGTTAAAFLGIGVGPRAMAQGGAFVAAADDATALYWNPAGLSRMNTGEVYAAHAEWLADLNFDYLGVAVPVLGGTAGVSVTSLSVPAMAVRTEDLQGGTGATFDAADLAVGLSYGRALTDRFSVGGTAKWVQQRIWNSSARGFAFDLGTQFRTNALGGMVIGAAITNFGTDLRMDGRDLRRFYDPDPADTGTNGNVPVDVALDSWGMPINFQIGVSATPYRTASQQLRVSLDALHPSNDAEALNLGAEYGFRDRFFLRAGYEGLFRPDAEGGLSAGLSVQYPLPYRNGMVKADYAFRAAGRFDPVHVVGLGFRF